MSTQEVARLSTEVANVQLKIGELDGSRQDLEANVPKVKGRCEEQESDVNRKCDAEESKLKKENEALLNQLEEWIEVDINAETVN